MEENAYKYLQFTGKPQRDCARKVQIVDLLVGPFGIFSGTLMLGAFMITDGDTWDRLLLGVLGVYFLAVPLIALAQRRQNKRANQQLANVPDSSLFTTPSQADMDDAVLRLSSATTVLKVVDILGSPNQEVLRDELGLWPDAIEFQRQLVYCDLWKSMDLIVIEQKHGRFLLFFRGKFIGPSEPR